MEVNVDVFACVCERGCLFQTALAPIFPSVFLSHSRSCVETSKSETFLRAFATTNQLIQIVFDIDAGPMSIY